MRQEAPPPFAPDGTVIGGEYVPGLLPDPTGGWPATPEVRASGTRWSPVGLLPNVAATETARSPGKAPAFARSTQKPLRVSFFGHFGSGNHGNESTLLTILSRLRSLSPTAEFRCVCTFPDGVLSTYGIEAIPISARKARLWDREIPLALRIPMAFIGVGAELSEYARGFKKLKGTDLLIVPGTGLVTDAYGLQLWGPYSMFKWVLMAKLRRAKVLFVSVGAGPIDSFFGRALVKTTLSLADYRSYRDDASRDYLTGIGFPAERDPVYPDLVFSLPEAMLPAEGPRPAGARRVVGLGLMLYFGKYSAADPSPDTYTDYLGSLATFAAWLLERNYDIRLLLGDRDSIVIEEFRSALEARLGTYDRERIIEQPINSVRDLLAGIAESDVVVATRFHNVLTAMLLNKPVLALSFHHKCSSLMRTMKLSDYCHDIHNMDADRLIAQFRELEQEREAVKRTIGRGLEQARVALDEQYDLLFTRVGSCRGGVA
jgi:polysaccharide pyruvyl transferase WcaK-like protein